MKVLITGATGLVGTEITKLCHEKNITVNYLTTSREKIKNDSNYQGFFWDPNEGKIDEQCIAGVDKVINLVGASVSKRWTARQKKVILNSRVKTADLLHQLLSQKEHQITQFISASAIGVYPSSLVKLYQETSTEVADTFLGDVVVKWERAADRFADLGIEVAKLRIGLVLANGGGALPRLKQPIENYVGAPLGSGKQWQSWIHLEDLARLFLFAAENNLDGVYNAVAPNPLTNKNLTKAVADQLNKRLVLPNIPPFVLKMILGEMATVVLSSQLVSNEKIEAQGFQFHYHHVTHALEDLIRKKRNKK